MRTADNERFTLARLEDRLLLSGTLLNAGATAMVYDAAGAVHVAYYDTADHTLKYTARSASGNWDPAITLDATPYAGVELAIALDATGRPAVAYYDGTNRDLKFAQKTKRGWTVQTLDAAGTVGHNPSLAFTPDGFPLVSYYAASTADLRLASFNGSRWYVSTIDATGSVGRFSDLAISPLDGSWAIAYESQSDHTIRYAQKWGKSFTTRVVDTLAGDANWLAKPSLAFNSTGNPLVSYVDGDELILNRAGRKTWSRSTIVEGGVSSADTALFVQSDAPRLLSARGGRFALSSATPANTWLTADLLASVPLATARAGDRIGLLGTDGSVTSVDPAAPPSLAVSAHLESGMVHVTWTNAPTDAASFAVERTLAGADDWQPVGDVASGTDGYWDSDGIRIGAAYEYRIRPVGGTTVAPFWSTAAIEISVPAPTLAATPKPGQEIDLQWQGWTPYAGYLEVERAVAGTTDFEPRLMSDYGGGLLVDTGDSGVNYLYRARLHAGADLVSGWATVTVGFSLPIDGVRLQVSGVTSGPANWTQGRVDLVWSGLPADAEYVTIERTPVGGGDPQVIWAWAGSGGYSDYTPESEGVSYTYRIRLSNDVAVSDFTPAVRADLPPAMNDNASADWTGSGVRVGWYDFSNHELGYRIERSGDDGAHYETIAQLVEPDANGGYFDATADERAAYRYRVTAVGEFAESAPVERWVTTGLRVATDLTATGVTESSVYGPMSAVMLSWDDNSARETGYELLFSTDGVHFATFATLGPDSTALTGVLSESNPRTVISPGRTYWFKIRPVDALGDYPSAESAVVQVTTPAAPPDGAAPADLQATTDYRSVHLTWTDQTSDETAWRIQRSDDGGTIFTTIADLPAGTQGYDDQGRSPSKTYIYRVIPMAGDVEGPAGTVTATTAPAIPLLLSGSALFTNLVELDWYTLPPDVQSLEIAYLSPVDGQVHTLATGIDPKLGFVRFGTLEGGAPFAGLTYVMWLVAVGPGGKTGSNAAYVDTSASAINLTATPISPTSVLLTRADVYQPIGTFYDLWWSRDGVTYTQFGYMNGTSLSYTRLLPDSTYWFKLRLISPGGASSFGDPITVHTPAST